MRIVPLKKQIKSFSTSSPAIFIFRIQYIAHIKGQVRASTTPKGLLNCISQGFPWVLMMTIPIKLMKTEIMLIQLIF